ncbi:unnamed protein product [Arctogadus glacialis]
MGTPTKCRPPNCRPYMDRPRPEMIRLLEAGSAPRSLRERLNEGCGRSPLGGPLIDVSRGSVPPRRMIVVVPTIRVPLG